MTLAHLTRSLLLTALAGAPLSAQASQVLVVDPGNSPGTDYLVLQDAIDAASDGDLILVRDTSASPGTFSATIDGKSLAVQAELPDTIRLRPLIIRNLSAGQSVVVRDCDGAAARTPEITDCAGTVRIENGTYRSGFLVTRVADLVLRSVRSVTSDGRDAFQNDVCFGGLVAVDSSIYLYDSIVDGIDAELQGIGGLNCYSEPAVRLTDSHLYVQAGTLSGGDGCDPNAWGSDCFTDDCPSSGVLASGSSSMERVDASITRGSLEGCTNNVPDVDGVTPFERASASGLVEVSSPLIEGDSATITIEGQPGDFVFLAMSFEPRVARYYAVAGYYHAGLSSTSLMAVGTLPASGSVSGSLPVPIYPGPDTVTPVYFQPYFVGSDRLLGAPSQVYVLDPSF